MTVKELINLLNKIEDKTMVVCTRLEDDDLMDINCEISQIAITEGHFDNVDGNEVWGKYLFFKL